jgi:hypothetical protein
MDFLDIMYHKDPLPKEVKQYFFNREIKYIEIFSKYSWSPIVQAVENGKIYIEFGYETLNSIIMDPNRSIDLECPDWKEQIWQIVKDIDNAGYYKLSLYPHCFFLNQNKEIKTIDFYACIEKDQCLMERSKIEAIIGKDSGGRFDSATEGDYINFKKFFEITMTSFLNKMWKDDLFLKFYRRLANDKLE